VISVLLLFLIAAWAGAAAAHADSDSSQSKSPDRSQAADEGQFLNLANGERASQGAQDLAVDSGLTDIARWWAARMAGASDIFHNYNLPNEVQDNWYKLGENVGMGGTVETLHRAFVKSPSHYQNLIDPAYAYVGIGVAYDSNGKLFVVFDFMDLQPPTPTTTPPAPTPAPQAQAGQGLTMVRPGTARPTPEPTRPAPPPEPAPAPVAAAPVPIAPDPPPVQPQPRAPSPALTGVLTELRSLDRHAAPARTRVAPTSTTTTIKRKPKATKEPTVTTKDAQTWTNPKPSEPKPAHKSERPQTPSDAAKAWLTPTYCDPKHPKGSC
jgi:hypothetical protein